MFTELATYESVQTVVMENGSTRLWSQNSRGRKADIEDNTLLKKIEATWLARWRVRPG